MKSFTFRVTARFALLVTATTAAVLALGGFLLERQNERGLELLHGSEARELADLLGPDGSLDAAAVTARIDRDADSDAAFFVIQVANAAGEVLYQSDSLGTTILPNRPEPEAHWTAALPDLGRVHLSVLTRGPWRIHIGSPLQPVERLLRDYIRISALLVLGVGLLGVWLGYGFSRATLRPIRAIEATANRIRADNLSERIQVPAGRDELAALTRLLNQMFDRLQASFEQVRRFSADVSHELKTPLALIRLNAEKLRPRLAGEPEAAAALGDILEQIAQLNQVIERLLFLAKAESGMLPLPMRRINVPEWLKPLAADAQALAEDRSVRFELAPNSAGEISGEPELLRQILLNLVSNAVAVSPPGGRVRLASEPAGTGWRFTVCDEGPGLPEAQLERIFERFVRLAPATPDGENTRGHGLGLAIGKSIVERHGGTIRARNRTDRSGLCVVVELPGG